MPEKPVLERMRRHESYKSLDRRTELFHNLVEVEALKQMVAEQPLSGLAGDEHFLKTVRSGIELYRLRFGKEPRILYAADEAPLSDAEREELHRKADGTFSDGERLLALAIANPAILSGSHYSEGLSNAAERLMDLTLTLGSRIETGRRELGKELYGHIHPLLVERFHKVELDGNKLRIGNAHIADIDFARGRLEVRPDAIGVFHSLLGEQQFLTVAGHDGIAVKSQGGATLFLPPNTPNASHLALPFSALYETLRKT